MNIRLPNHRSGGATVCLAREEDPDKIGNNSQPDWSTFHIAFSTSG